MEVTGTIQRPYIIKKVDDVYHILNGDGVSVRNGMHREFIFARLDAAIAFCQTFGVHYTIE